MKTSFQFNLISFTIFLWEFGFRFQLWNYGWEMKSSREVFELRMMFIRREIIIRIRYSEDLGRWGFRLAIPFIFSANNEMIQKVIDVSPVLRKSVPVWSGNIFGRKWGIPH